MQLEDYFDFNTHPVEHIRIRGTRVNIEHVIERYQMGIHPDRIAAESAVLSPDQVYAVLTYYHRNKDEVEAYIERGHALFAAFVRESRDRPESDAAARIRAIKADWEAATAGPPT